MREFSDGGVSRPVGIQLNMQDFWRQGTKAKRVESVKRARNSYIVYMDLVQGTVRNERESVIREDRYIRV